MFGGQTSLIVGFASAAAWPPWSASSTGPSSGFFGGWVDAAHDADRRRPALDPGALPPHRPGDHLPRRREVLLILVIAFVSWLVPARLIRGETLSLRVREYVQAVRVHGREPDADRRPPHHPQRRRHHRGLRHLPGGRLHPAAGRPGLPRARPARPRDRLGQPCSPTGSTTAGNGYWWQIYPAGLASCWWWSPSTSSATPCGTPSRSGSSAADRGAQAEDRGGTPVGRRSVRPGSAAGSGRRPGGPRRTRSSGGSSSAQISWPAGSGCGTGTPTGGRWPRAARPGPCTLLGGRAVDHVGHRHGVEEALGVGVGRVVVHLDGRAQLDQLAQVHDPDGVGHVADHGQVVGDHDVGRGSPALLEVLHQVEDLGLDGDVEGRDRLVGHDQLGLEGQRPGQADPLALAAGELVGVAVDAPRAEPPRPAARSPARAARRRCRPPAP